jgi:putative transposase
MARLQRLAVAGVPHLISQRVLRGLESVVTEADHERYLRLLATAAASSGIDLHAFCIERSQTLLLLTPHDATGPSRLMQAIGRSYVADFNRRHERAGPLFEGRFRCTVVDPQLHLVEAMLYVEQAPLRAAAVPAQTYRWSSAAHHSGTAHAAFVRDHPVWWHTGNTPFEREARHRAALDEPLAPAVSARFDAALQGGWAVGGAEFLVELGKATSRRLLPAARGRPRKLASGSPE